jgi:signal transduction histidine kinase
MIRGTMIELRQVILNLLQNALEAMPEGGTLTVGTGLEGHMVRISITDTGIGVPQEAESEIFSAFFSTKPEGSGLGLFTANRIVKECGGKICFESDGGKGTCFSILLPVYE